MFHNETHDPKGQENKIYTIVKGRETFYRITQSQSPAVVKSNMFLKGYPLEAKTALSLGFQETYFNMIHFDSHRPYTMSWIP